MGVKVTGIEEANATVRGWADTLADEKFGLEVLLEASQPLAQRIKENLEPHRRTGKTEADVHVAEIQSPGPGIAKVAIGASGGKSGRGREVTWLEFGTPHEAASPIVRPAWDSEQGGF